MTPFGPLLTYRYKSPPDFHKVRTKYIFRYRLLSRVTDKFLLFPEDLPERRQRLILLLLQKVCSFMDPTPQTFLRNCFAMYDLGVSLLHNHSAIAVKTLSTTLLRADIVISVIPALSLGPKPWSLRSTGSVSAASCLKLLVFTCFCLYCISLLLRGGNPGPKQRLTTLLNPNSGNLFFVHFLRSSTPTRVSATMHCPHRLPAQTARTCQCLQSPHAVLRSLSRATVSSLPLVMLLSPQPKLRSELTMTCTNFSTLMHHGTATILQKLE